MLPLRFRVGLGAIAKKRYTQHSAKVIYKALCFDVAQGRINGAPNETRTHSCRFASLACPLSIPQSSRFTGALPSDCLVSYPEHWLGVSYLSAVGIFSSPSRLGYMTLQYTSMTSHYLSASQIFLRFHTIPWVYIYFCDVTLFQLLWYFNNFTLFFRFAYISMTLLYLSVLHIFISTTLHNIFLTFYYLSGSHIFLRRYTIF